MNSKTSINCNGNLLDLSKPVVMGILNITPDSFYSNSRHSDINLIDKHISKMLEAGATIVDIGAYSSRPGAKHISEKEELDRLLPVFELILRKYPELIFSVDTFRANIADVSIKNYNAAIINDISSGDMDSKMFNVVAKHNVPYIIMHMQGTPQNMQQNPIYSNIISEIIDYFVKKNRTFKQIRSA